MNVRSEIPDREAVEDRTSRTFGSRFSLEGGSADHLFRSSLKSNKSTTAIRSALSDNRRVQAPSDTHSNGTGVIENGIDLIRGSDLNTALAFTGMEREPTVGACAICGRPLTQGGRCLRCLADLGFLSGSQEPGPSETLQGVFWYSDVALAWHPLPGSSQVCSCRKISQPRLGEPLGEVGERYCEGGRLTLPGQSRKAIPWKLSGIAMNVLAIRNVAFAICRLPLGRVCHNTGGEVVL